MSFKIWSTQHFLFMFFSLAFGLYLLFKVFHFYYPGNYCDIFSDTVIENSPEEIEAMKLCVSTLLCEVGTVKRTKQYETDIEVKKEFICIRKNQVGIWKK